MNRTPAATIGLVICALLGILDVVTTFGAGSDDAPPMVVIVIGLVLGLITLAATVPAWRGNRTGVMAVIASRAAGVLLAVPAYFDDAAPTWVRVVVTVVIAASLAGIGLLVVGLRHRPARLAS
jgi:hypothetical protein